jgi:SAM-dependent methyltransferase
MNYIIKPYMLFAFIFSVTLVACIEPDKTSETGKKSEMQDQNVLVLPVDENKDRATWQKPETVVAMLGDLDGKIIADIGAGTGYFTFRFAMNAAKVIAIDIVPGYLAILDNLKLKLPQEIYNKIETRLGKTNDPMLDTEEVDLVIMINTFNEISDKLEYLQTVKKGIKQGGKIFFVDFKIKNLPIDAPDINKRISIYELENMLSRAGFTNIITDDTTLDYQFVVTAIK